MHRPAAIALFAFCLTGSGCALVRDAVSLSCYQVRENIEDCRESKRNRQWANDAWDRLAASGAPCAGSEDYEAGYKDGFSHYLLRGGTGEPPALPPKHYRAMKYQDAAGYAAIESWFAGYRHGAADAAAGGYRRWVTGPTSTVASALESTIAPPLPTPIPEPVAATEPVAVSNITTPPPVRAKILGLTPEPAPPSAPAQKLLPERAVIQHIYVRPMPPAPEAP